MRLVVERLQFPEATDKFDKIYEGPLELKHIAFCSGNVDALLLDLPFCATVEGAPISHQILQSQKVHIFGFSSNFPGHNHYMVPGEITSVGAKDVLVSCSSVPGLSGGAIVCDGSLGVIAYVGGALSGKDNSPFGAYGFKVDSVLLLLGETIVETHQVLLKS